MLNFDLPPNRRKRTLPSLRAVVLPGYASSHPCFAALFEAWLRDWDEEFATSRCKICLQNTKNAQEHQTLLLPPNASSAGYPKHIVEQELLKLRINDKLKINDKLERLISWPQLKRSVVPGNTRL